MLNAVVAELDIHELNDSVLSDERLGAKLRVTENRCVIFNRSTHVYIYIYIYIYIDIALDIALWRNKALLCVQIEHCTGMSHCR